MRDFVSEKTIGGSVYTLLRDSSDPRRNFIVCDGDEKEVSLSIWPDDAAIEALWP